MSHIFISYAHTDKVHLDTLVTWLRSHAIVEQDLWYDHHIEGGTNWRDEIAVALDKAYVVLVFITSKSVKSLYCTYEWAYAMGQGIPILPLIFEEVSIADVPSPLTARQFINCTQNIPDSLHDQLKRLRSVPPQVAEINRIVYEAIYDTHRRFFILGWLGNEVKALDAESRESVMNYFVKEASKAYQVIQALMIDKAFALSGKQYRLCWQIIDFLQEFSRLHRKYEGYFKDRLYNQFDTTWLPAFEYFEGDGWWRRWTRSHFERDLDDEYNRMAVFAEMMRAFPDFDALEAGVLINNVNAERKRKGDSNSNP